MSKVEDNKFCFTGATIENSYVHDSEDEGGKGQRKKNRTQKSWRWRRDYLQKDPDHSDYGFYPIG